MSVLQENDVYLTFDSSANLSVEVCRPWRSLFAPEAAAGRLIVHSLLHTVSSSNWSHPLDFHGPCQQRSATFLLGALESASLV